MADEEHEQPRLELSVTQIVASALAAMTAAVLASFLGVAGTLIGTAVMSIIATTGSALYKESIRRTHERLRTLVVPLDSDQEPAHAPAGVAVVEEPRRHWWADLVEDARHWLRRRWKPLVATVVVVFVVAVAGITVVEAIAGRSLAAAVHGRSGGGGGGYTIYPGPGGGPSSPSPTPTASASTTASPSETESSTASPEPSISASTEPSTMSTPPGEEPSGEPQPEPSTSPVPTVPSG